MSESLVTKLRRLLDDLLCKYIYKRKWVYEGKEHHDCLCGFIKSFEVPA